MLNDLKSPPSGSLFKFSGLVRTRAQQYMWMKLQSAEFEDVEIIEESINVFKHYMLNKIDE